MMVVLNSNKKILSWFDSESDSWFKVLGTDAICVQIYPTPTQSSAFESHDAVLMKKIVMK